MNENTDYELLTRKIYQLLLKYEGFDDIEVKHNVKIKGKSKVDHQIDVYWEFKTVGVTHRVAIECKNYNSSITLGRIRDFHSVLQDIGNISGIIVTKLGFQSGVLEYAKHHGIDLKLLRNPIEDDWTGKLKRIVLDINIIKPKINDWKINIDEEWAKINIDKEKLELAYNLNGINNQIWILDANGNKYKNFLDLEESLPNKWHAEFDLKHTYEFPDHYVDVNPLGRLKLKNVIVKYDVIAGKAREVIIDAEQVVDKVLKDAITNTIQFIHRDGTVK